MPGCFNKVGPTELNLGLGMQILPPCKNTNGLRSLGILRLTFLSHISKKSPIGPTNELTLKKPEYLIARSQLTWSGARWDSVPGSIFDGNKVGPGKPSYSRYL